MINCHPPIKKLPCLKSVFGLPFLRELTWNEIRKFVGLYNTFATSFNDHEANRNKPLMGSSLGGLHFLTARRGKLYIFSDDRHVLLVFDVRRWDPWVTYGFLLSPFRRRPLRIDQVIRARMYGQKRTRAA